MILKLNLNKEKMYNEDREVYIEVQAILEGTYINLYKMTPIQYKNYCSEIYGGGTLRNKCRVYYIEVGKDTGLEFETAGEGWTDGNKYYYSYYDSHADREFDTEADLIMYMVNR